jgi:hypothetical protein
VDQEEVVKVVLQEQVEQEIVHQQVLLKEIHGGIKVVWSKLMEEEVVVVEKVGAPWRNSFSCRRMVEQVYQIQLQVRQ